MKQITKTLLSVLLAAAMLCGMLTPAFAWTATPSRLQSPNGVFWFDMNAFFSFHWQYVSSYSPEMSISIYSRDGVIWYTMEGLAHYEDIAQAPDENWRQSIVADDLASPDGGMIWLDPDPSGWIDWKDYYPDLNTMPQYVYSESDSLILRTNPFSGYEEMIPVSRFGVDRPVGTACSFIVDTAPDAGILLLNPATTGWKTQLCDADWAYDIEKGANPTFYDYCTYLQPIGSVNPRRNMQCTRFDTSDYPQVTLSNTDWYNSGFCYRYMFYFIPVRECTVRVNMEIQGADFMYALPDFTALINTQAQITYNGNTYSGSIDYDDIPILNTQGHVYHPANAYGNNAWADDVNNNFVIDTQDQLSSFGLIDDYIDGSVQSISFTIHLERMPYSFPVYLWAEGQDTIANGEITNTNCALRMNFMPEIDAEELYEYPIYFCESADAVVITDFNSAFIRNANYNGSTIIPSNDGCTFDVTSGTLTLPGTIHGKPVTAIEDGALLSVTDSLFFDDRNEPGTCSVRKVILPNTIEHLGCDVIGDIPERVHVPFGAVPSSECSFRPMGFMGQNTSGHMTICCDAPNSMIQRWVTENNMSNDFTFIVCTEHGSSHVHLFGDWSVTTEPTCETPGEQIRTCTVCGTTETVTLTALGHDFGEWVETTSATHVSEGTETRTCARCAATETRTVPILPSDAEFTITGGRAHPGGTVKVSVLISNNPGITSALLNLQYDRQILTLTAVENGDVFDDTLFYSGNDLQAVPFTMCWSDPLSATDNTSDGTLVTFTFAVAANAPLGKTPVTVTYDPDSTFNSQMQEITFAVSGGEAEIYARLPGDSNGDGDLNLKDVTAILRYLVGGWESPEPDLMNADVNGDGKVNLKDVIILRRYLAGWSVELR